MIGYQTLQDSTWKHLWEIKKLLDLQTLLDNTRQKLGEAES